ncbi:hypothetical protein A0H77_19610 [Vibrio alginolyticus]|uniref:hypothetical protein n=1 Tax=Vibrio alginolyticus TaxID=663 RepID=UPI00079A788F|nr:hypothetical protein [Vibrio alginolyticus]KXZ35106.1 hypothetical protein A0H77_19610 [Vibrio alginolyticus]
MKIKVLLLSGILAICNTALAKDMYEFSKSTYHSKEKVVIEEKQTIHKYKNIWYLKKIVRTVDKSGRKPYTKTFYQCFNGTPNDPYKNLSQSWQTTDSKLSGCPTNLSDK